MVKYLLIFLGFASLALGIIGIFVPILPTTPFLLLAAALFIRSSERLYQWIISNRLFGRYIKDFREKGGMTAGGKASAIALMWGMIAVSALIIGFNAFVFILGAVGSVVMGFVIKTVK